MAKIARTPFNASRMITGVISESRNLSGPTKGYTYFIDSLSEDEIVINIDYTDKGSYYKFILREDSQGLIKIQVPALVALVISKSDAEGTVVYEGTGTYIDIAPGSKAGTYVDLICDGEKWYARGMSAGTIPFAISE